jgi:hypothetical protein
MGYKHTLTIKDWLGTGTGNLKIHVRESVTSKKTIGSVKYATLQITRKPDKHSSCLAMMAHLRRTQRGYQSLGFPEATLTCSNRRLSSQMDFPIPKENLPSITTFLESGKSQKKGCQKPPQKLYSKSPIFRDI